MRSRLTPPGSGHQVVGEVVALLLLDAGADVAAESEADVRRCTEMCPAVGSLLEAAQQETSCAAEGRDAGGSEGQVERQSGEVRSTLYAGGQSDASQGIIGHVLPESPKFCDSGH